MELRKYIRKVLNEEINNFIEKQPETETKHLKDSSKSEVLGDPLDVKMNKTADNLGSDGKNSPTVSVTAGKSSSNDGSTNSGQLKPTFSGKTKMAK